MKTPIPFGAVFPFNLVGELRHAGFPQREDIFFPTLDGLIDWCGSDFNTVELAEKESSGDPDNWVAIGRLGQVTAIGATKEIAVAKLGLALKKAHG